MSERRGDPVRLGDLVGEVAGQPRWRRRLEGAGVFARWREIVGEDLALRCEPVRITGQTLLVRAENQAWATEVGYLRGHLVSRIEEVLGLGIVADVKVVAGTLEGVAGRPSTEPPTSL